MYDKAVKGIMAIQWGGWGGGEIKKCGGFPLGGGDKNQSYFPKSLPPFYK